jgi:hypothetical protein
MNYSKHYNLLIERSKHRNLDTYTESHHIIPKCMGGSDDSDNLAILTPEEHYIAHLLLIKMYPDNDKLLFAAKMMSNRNNKNYGWVRRKFSSMIRRYNTGYKHTEESKLKMSKARKGVKKPEDHKSKIGESNKKLIEYKGIEYKGYADLLSNTGVTRHLYLKFYLNGIDPEPYIGNNTHALKKYKGDLHPKNSLGKVWANNGLEEKYFDLIPEGWVKGRLKKEGVELVSF